MLNQVVLVGRLTSNPEVTKVDEKEVSIITLAVPRSYKNVEGVYDTDFIEIVLWKGIATNTVEYCKKGDVVGVRGRVETITNEDNTIKMQIVAEKVTFLSSVNKKDEGEN